MSSKLILKQYNNLKVEIKELECRIKTLDSYETQIERDIVKGSCTNFPYNEISVHIEGYNIEDSERKMTRIRKLQCVLKDRINNIEDMKVDIEKFISEIPDSRTRRVFQYRYIDNLSWQAIAMRMNKVHESYPRKIHDRYLNK